MALKKQTNKQTKQNKKKTYFRFIKIVKWPTFKTTLSKAQSSRT